MKKKVEYQISSFVNEDILEITLTGEITEDAVSKLEFEVIAIIKSNNLKNLLVDFRAIKGRFGYIEAYERVRNYPPDRYRVKNAIVDIPEHADYESFQETTARNAGLAWKCFTDVEEARVWLKGE